MAAIVVALIINTNKKLKELEAKELSQWKAQSDPNPDVRMPPHIFKQLNEELLKEKTGKDYSFEDKKFEITLSDIIGFVTNSNVDPFWGKMLTDFFEKLNDIEEKEKKRLL